MALEAIQRSLNFKILKTRGLSLGCSKCILGAVRVKRFNSIRLKVSVSCSVVSNSLQPRGLEPIRLLCPWDSPGKKTGVGCHALLQGIFPTQGWNLSLMSPALAGGFFTTSTTQEAQIIFLPKLNSLSSKILPMMRAHSLSRCKSYHSFFFLL